LTALAGRLAVVTGASRGIGLAAAGALAGAGATVIRLARSFPDAGGAGCHDLPCDLTDAAQILRASTRILEDWGAPGIVVQSAGVFLLKPFEETQTDELDRQLALNLRAPFLLARGLVPGMRAKGGGRFITIGSICDHLGYPDNSAYAASKFGVRGLHEALAAEYRGTGVRFTLISPGPVDTGIWDPFDPDARPGFLPRALMLCPEDVADAVLFAATRPPGMNVDWLRLSPSSVDG